MTRTRTEANKAMGPPGLVSSAVDELRRERDVALERLAALAEILSILGQARADVDAVLRVIVASAARLCHADSAYLVRHDGGVLHPGPFHGEIPEDERALLTSVPRMPIHSQPQETLIGRVVTTRQVVHVADIRSDPDLGRVMRESNYASLALRYGTMLGVPVMREDEILGMIELRRRIARPFDDQEIAVVEAFADQAAIAIEQVRLFKEIDEKSHQLEVASRNKSDFLANMSHELRTPLNAIIGFSELLLDKVSGDLTERQAEYVHDILLSGTHQLAVINDVLDMSKVEAGRLDLELSTFSASGTALDAVAFVRARAAQRGITLSEQLDPGLGDIEADPRKVRQILVNLLSNAVKFTPDGGVVVVKGKRVDDEITIAVSDTGVGIAPEDLSLIFREFGQTASARGHEGTGLGLALAKRLIELHGGRIWVDSILGRGSTFTIALPVLQNRATQA